MNPVSRMLLAMALALIAYTVYWKAWGLYRHTNAHVIRWSPSDLALRNQRAGLSRIYLGWVLAFVTYALAIEDSGYPFSAHWWQESLFAGDWIGVLLFSSVMSFAEWHRASTLRARAHSRVFDQAEEEISASP